MKMNYNNGRVASSEEREILTTYMQAMGSTVEMFDHNYQPIWTGDNGHTGETICRYCIGSAAGAAGNDAQCRTMHRDTMLESARHGCSYIYQCELGLTFWVSPIYHDNALSGSLRGSGYISGDIDTAAIAAKCKTSYGCQTPAENSDAVSPEEFVRRIRALSCGDEEKIRSLAEMLLLCASALSSDSENYREKIRLRRRQMENIAALINELKAKHGEDAAPPNYPLDKEHGLITALSRGDGESAQRFLNELLAALVVCRADNYRHIQLGALELAVLLARTGTNSGSAAVDSSARFIAQIQEAKSVEDLSGALHDMVESIAASVSLFHGIPHASAMRKAERFIRKNLSRRIGLQEVADVAGLSAPYFSTIFKEEMGENLSRYINRLRVEKAVKLLLETSLSLSDIAIECCFDDQSWFSKIFKSFTGLSPGKYRSQGGN